MSAFDRQREDILLLDDHPEHVRMLQQILTTPDYHIRQASDEAAFLHAVQTDPPAVILLSTMMPDMDGWAVCRRLKADELTRDIPALFLLNGHDPADIANSFAAGGADYITMPFQPAEAAARVCAQVNLRQARRQSDAQHLRFQEEIAGRQRTEASLRYRNQELAILNQMSQLFNSSLELDRVLITILHEIHQLLNITAVSVWLRTPDGNELVCRQAVGAGSDTIIGWRLPIGTGLVGKTAHDGERIWVRDSRIEPRHYKEVDEKTGVEIRSLLSIPLRVGGNVVGVLDLVDAGIDRFTEEDVRFVTLIAASAAHSIENARLYTLSRQEILERQQAEDALRASEERYRAVFENAVIGIGLVNSAGQFVEVNHRLCEMFGYRADEIGQTSNLLVTYSDDIAASRDKLQALLRGDISSYRIEKRYIRKDGGVFWGDVSVSPIHDSAGQIVFSNGMIIDITERKRAEAELQAAHQELQDKNTQLWELNASKDKFFSIISHDLRNPFAALLGFTELLAKHIDTYTSEEIQDRADKIHKSAERLYTLLENLLTWSRLQRGIMEYAPYRIELREIIANISVLFHSVAEQKQIRMINSIGEEIWVYGDYAMVNTVIRNLLSNALKFTPSGGAVTVAVRQDAREVEVSIADTGCGMDQETMAQLFRIDTHYTTIGTAGETGTGLGLILCQDLVKKNGGRIWMESDAGKGATFRFTIPNILPK